MDKSSDYIYKSKEQQQSLHLISNHNRFSPYCSHTDWGCRCGQDLPFKSILEESVAQDTKDDNWG